jgi:Transposase DDE domain group 1
VALFRATAYWSLGNGVRAQERTRKKAPRRGQGRVASGRALPARRLHRHQPGSVCRAVAFYNQRGTAKQWIKEGKGAIKWTRLSCRTFAANAVRLQLHALAYNLGNFMRTLAMPKAVEPWLLTSLREKLIKIGAKVVSHGRYVTFQMAEAAVSRLMFRDILMLIARLRAPPSPT